MHKIHDKIDAYYTSRLSEHGPTARGVDWNSEDSQRLRFDRLAEAVPRTGNVTVLDFGCGYGAFLEYLQEVNPHAQYVGYDVSRAMVNAANDRYGQRGVFTSDAAALRPADVVVASGIFNVKMDVPNADWEAHVFETLERIAALARNALAFNVLTIYSDPHRMRGDLYYADPDLLFKWCQRRYSKWVSIFHDYGLYEFTIVTRKVPDNDLASR